MRSRMPLTAAALGLAAAACLTLNTGAAPAAVPAAAPAPAHLTIGIKYDQPGLAVHRPGRTPEGFDVDVATYIAKSLGVTPDHITWKQAPSDRREEMIESGAVDFAVASYSITAERKQRVTFAGPYLTTGQDLLVRAGTRGITGPDSLNGRTVCTATGSTSAAKIKRDFAAKTRLISRETYSACVDALLRHKADAVTTDDIILAGYAAQHPGELRVVGHRFTRERYGVGLKKGDAALQQRITTAIQQMIKDGSWRRSLKRHVPAGYELPAPPPVFNAPDAPVGTPSSGSADPALVQATHRLIDGANAEKWDEVDALICDRIKGDVDKLVSEFTPAYDPNLGPWKKKVRFHNTVVGIAQTSPTSATMLVHESFTGVPAKYRNYVKDIDYNGTMTKTKDGWKLCALAADFQEG
ncbi:glutamate ABC transporter substrate-binding protein [Streptomyces sp. NPDC059009]|uniref:glutamate ABC transporter substrate-binding protein n=1 Tax=Streptomyces sp. NPDC059009 TaxID=3346694 RepID=UPI0036B2FD1E